MSDELFLETGVLAPYIGDVKAPKDTSPYEVTCQVLMDALGRTPARSALILQLLKYRCELRATGAFDGESVMCLDGSFCERRQDAPGDVDVLFIYRWATGASLEVQREATKWLSAHVAKGYCCDMKPVDLDWSPAVLSRRLTRWLGLFSHTKDGRAQWKGMVSMKLAAQPGEDALLERLEARR